jgi:hypothetical protein
MRLILALAILLLGLSSAAPEPEYSSVTAGSFHFARGATTPSLIEIESSTGKDDRLVVASLTEVEPSEPSPAQIPLPDDASIDRDQPITLGELCNVLLTSAQDNGLPVAFFANLIWQESGLRDDIVSRKGAQGIAQFMPETARESGLDNPFDPLQALPASARLLRELRTQFGNLGYVAAAYNAGPRRVSAWLERHRTLPRETRGYVLNITGRSVEQWRSTPPQDTALRFVRRLPCRDLPAFVELEQAQPGPTEQAQAQPPQELEKTEVATRDRHGRFGDRRYLRRGPIRAADGDQRGAKHEAKEHLRHVSHERHRPA